MKILVYIHFQAECIYLCQIYNLEYEKWAFDFHKAVMINYSNLSTWKWVKLVKYSWSIKSAQIKGQAIQALDCKALQTLGKLCNPKGLSSNGLKIVPQATKLLITFEKSEKTWCIWCNMFYERHVTTSKWSNENRWYNMFRENYTIIFNI